MSRNNYIELIIDGQKADIDPEGQVPTVTYQLEDEQNFEQKKSAECFNVEMPSTLINDQIHNTLHNPSIPDNSAGQVFDNFKPCRYIANGQEILIGKYLVQSGVKRNGRPEKYRGKIYGLNGDWVIDLKEKSIYDFINTRTHTFDAATIIGTWDFDGRNEAEDFVYAPVRYRKPFGATPAATEENPNPQPLDDNVLISDMKPSISVYWLLWRAFKSVGYRLVSQFMDTDLYRKSLLPWTWGGFDFMDDSRWEPLKFVAAQNESIRFEGDHDDEFPDLQVKDDGTVPGTYDNSGVFTYTNGASVLPFMMMFTYPTAPPSLNLGKIKVNFSLRLSHAYKVQNNSDASLYVFWYKNGVQVAFEPVYSVNSGAAQTLQAAGFDEMTYEVDIIPGDYIGARVRIHLFESGTGFARQDVKVEGFSINFVKLTDGSSVNFNNYPKFKNFKWLDLLRGEIDLFDLLIQTDPIRKEVYIEPAHAYDINGTPYQGYYNRKQLDWSQKIDISQESELELFSDYQREFVYKFKDDSNDGGLKKVQDRNQTTIGQAKYVLPERYKTEKKELENRFYSPVMHYEHDQFKNVTGVAPQLVAIIPENISNTSSSESENIYNPKRTWYKGNVTGYGGWYFNGNPYTTLPFMFAVNYKPGGENDPVLSYADQFIGGVVAKGLMKKFFLQRMAIFRNGRRYNPINVILNNNDVANFLHRESIIIENIEYLLTMIDQYNPMEPDESTACMMWMFVPTNQQDASNSYPSIQSVQAGGLTNSFDVKYWHHKLLTSDITE